MREEDLYKIILSPLLSEKSTRVADKHRQYVFRVRKDANKPSIKRAVEKMFNVEVESVQVINMLGKRKGSHRTPGFRPNTKKAYVRLKPGHDIDFISA
jgi:large subunit ribosomal protein L23